MKSLKKAILFSLAVWVVPFIVAMLIFPLRANERPLFESIMPVATAIGIVIFSILYFKKVDANPLKEGILLGIIWFIMSIVIDLMMFMQGPMKMSFGDYVKDVGITYLLIPVITISFGILLNKKK